MKIRPLLAQTISVGLLTACNQGVEHRPAGTLTHEAQQEAHQLTVDRERRLSQKNKRLSQAELSALPRDKRRTEYLTGFTCEWMFQGQPAYTRYSKGRVAYGHHEGESTSAWKIQNDEICYVTERNKRTCYNLPKKDLAGGQSEFLEIFQKSCI